MGFVKKLTAILSVVQILFGLLVVLDAMEALKNTGAAVMVEFYIGVAIIVFGLLFLISAILGRNRNQISN